MSARFLVVAYRSTSVRYVKTVRGSLLHRAERGLHRFAERQMAGRCARVEIVRVAVLRDGTWHRSVIAEYGRRATGRGA